MRRALEEADTRLGEQSSARTAAEVRAAELEERAAEFEARAAEAESENAELRAQIRSLTGK